MRKMTKSLHVCTKFRLIQDTMYKYVNTMTGLKGH